MRSSVAFHFFQIDSIKIVLTFIYNNKLSKYILHYIHINICIEIYEEIKNYIENTS